MELSLNEKGELVIKQTVEQITVYDLKKKRRELRTSIDSKKEVLEQIKKELEQEQIIMKWIKENIQEEEEEVL